MTLETAWTPRKNQVIVRQLEAPSRSAGGLLLPEDARDAPQQGVVLAVGPDVPTGISAGDVVAFGKFAGIPFDDPMARLPLLVMQELECILHRPAASVRLVEHDTRAGRRVIHEDGVPCEHCPTPELDDLRARLRAANREALADEPKVEPGDAL